MGFVEIFESFWQNSDEIEIFEGKWVVFYAGKIEELKGTFMRWISFYVEMKYCYFRFKVDPMSVYRINFRQCEVFFLDKLCFIWIKYVVFSKITNINTITFLIFRSSGPTKYLLDWRMCSNWWVFFHKSCVHNTQNIFNQKLFMKHEMSKKKLKFIF